MAGVMSDMHLHFTHGRVDRVKVYRRFPAFLAGDTFVENDNTGGPRHVPGIRIAVNFERLPEIQFSHGFGMWKQERLSASELAIIQFINDITEEENWHRNVDDFAVTSRWKALALAEYFSRTELWDWCLYELRQKAKEYSGELKTTLALDSASRVFKSDRLRCTDFVHHLASRTWGCSVSPWLYPFIYGATPIRADGINVTLQNVASSIGGGLIPYKPFWDSDRWSGELQYYSATSQWLAAEVKFTGQGNAVKFVSPANNLHPGRLSDLYSAIETLIADSIPEWNQVLLYKSLQRNGPRIRPQDYRCNRCAGPPNKSCTCVVQFNNFTEWAQGNIGSGTELPPTGRRWSPSSALNGRYTYTGMLYNNISLREACKDRGMQVYVEIASIEVNADGSVHPDSLRRFEWDLNGNRNERIVATTLLCLRRDNIKNDSGVISFQTETKLSHWEAKSPTSCQNLNICPDPGVPVVGRPAPPPFQQLVTVQLPVGRTISFPNALQHRFGPLERVDETQPGTLQFLAVHLADPHYNLLSTMHVPPQSASWWWEAADLGYVCWHHRIPLELRRFFVDFAVGEGYGHSHGDEGANDEGGNEEDGNEEDDNEEGDNDEGDNEEGDNEEGDNEEGQRANPEFSPETVREERPIRIKAATRMRTKAFEEHKRIMEALNTSRVYGVPSTSRVWYKRTAVAGLPLDHGEPQEYGHMTVNAAIGTDETVFIVPPDGGEESDYEDEDEDYDVQQNANGAPVAVQQHPPQQWPQQAAQHATQHPTQHVTQQASQPPGATQTVHLSQHQQPQQQAHQQPDLQQSSSGQQSLQHQQDGQSSGSNPDTEMNEYYDDREETIEEQIVRQLENYQ